MSKFDRVLSDDEVDDIVKNTTMLLGRSIARSKDFILKVEQAVLAKLAEQEPAGYVAKAPFDADYFKYGDRINFYKKESHLLSEFSKATPIPLYAHPIPETKEHHRTAKNYIPDGRSIEDLADDLYTKGYKEGGVKDWDPRGCREWQDVVDAYDSKFPEGWQLVPDQLNNEMAQALRLGSRKDYPSDLLCEVRYTALLAAAPKYTGEK